MTLLPRLLLLLYCLVALCPASIAKQDTVVLRLKTEVKQLKHELEGMAQSTDVENIRREIEALQEKIDYLSEGQDRGLTVAWSALAVIATIAGVVLVVNLVVANRTVLNRVERGLNEAQQFLSNEVDMRVNGALGARLQDIDDQIAKVKLSMWLMEIEALAKAAKYNAGFNWLLPDRVFEKQMRWLAKAWELEEAYPQLDNNTTQALDGLRLYLADTAVSLLERQEIEDALSKLGDKHPVHVQAVRVAIKLNGL